MDPPRIRDLVRSTKSAWIAFVVALAALHGGLGWYAARTNFVTVNEARQVPAGLSHWKAGVFSIANDTPPLSRLIASLPLLASQPYFEVSNEIALPFLAKARDRRELRKPLLANAGRDTPSRHDRACPAGRVCLVAGRGVADRPLGDRAVWPQGRASWTGSVGHRAQRSRVRRAGYSRPSGCGCWRWSNLFLLAITCAGRL